MPSAARVVSEAVSVARAPVVLAARFAAFAIGLTLSCLPGVARAAEAVPDSAGTVLWSGAAAGFAWPLADFDAPGNKPQFGGAHVSIQSGSSAVGVRLAFGRAISEVVRDGVPVEVLPGSTSNETVKAGNDLWWILIGAQWDPRPRDTSVYGFVSLGAMKVNPRGVAGSGTTVHPEVPGMPPGSNVLAYGAGAGSRLVAGKARRLGLYAEVEYLHGGAADHIGSAGVEGNPTRYASRNSPIEIFIVKLGIAQAARHRGSRQH